MNCGQRFCTIPASKRRTERLLPGAEQAGARVAPRSGRCSSRRESASGPTVVSTNGRSWTPSSAYILRQKGSFLPLPLEPAMRRSTGRTAATQSPSPSSAGSPRKTRVGVGEDEGLVVELALGPGRDGDLVEGRDLGEALDQRLVDDRHAERLEALDGRRLGARGRGAGRRRRRARRPRRRPRRAGSRPAARPRSRACRARRRSGNAMSSHRAGEGRESAHEHRLRRATSPPVAGLRLSTERGRVFLPSGWTRASATRPASRASGAMPLRRRLLALADLIAAAAASVVVASSSADAFWALALLPAWVVIAKLIGLYDRDHAAIRHLTIDELPAIAAWAGAGVALLALVLPQTPAGEVDASAPRSSPGSSPPSARWCCAARRAGSGAAIDAARGHGGARRRRPRRDDPAQARAVPRHAPAARRTGPRSGRSTTSSRRSTA